MDQDLDWPRLIDAVVATVDDLRYYPTAAGLRVGVGEGTMRAWLRGERGTPRGKNRAALLTYAAKTWPDYRDRFAPSATSAGEDSPDASDLVSHEPDLDQPNQERNTG
jgi:hypothetical protein